MFHYTIAVVSILALASAAPAVSLSLKHFALNQLARFDNDENGVQLLAASPVNLYNDIYWNAFVLAPGGASSGVGIKPNSPPNIVAYTAVLGTGPLQGQAAMTVNYADSTIDHFDLSSFYYACALSVQVSAAAVPTDCVITVKGYLDNNAEKEVASQEFKYKTGGLLAVSTQMQKATLNQQFKGLKRVNFYTDSILKAGVVDTVAYTVYGEVPLGSN